MTAIPIDHIEMGERVREDLGDLWGLAESIKERGLLQPVAITPDTQLIDGQRRIEACRLLNRTEIEVHVIDVDDLLLGERDANEQRKNFTPSEAVKIGRLIEKQLKPQADAARRAALARGRATQGRRPGADGSATLAEPSGAVREKAAAAVGLAHTTYDRAKKVVEAAEADPARFGDLPTEMDRTGNITGAHKELERRKVVGDKQSVNGKGERRLKKPPAPVLLERIRSSLAAAAGAVEDMDVQALGLDAEEAAGAIRDLSSYLTALRRFVNQIKEYHTDAR